MPRFVACSARRDVRVVDLLGLVRLDYEVRRLKSVHSARISLGHIASLLGDFPATGLHSNNVLEYVVVRRQQGAAEATIRIELALLRRGYILGVRQRLVPRAAVPDDLPRIEADKLMVRRGFLDEEEVRKVCLYLESDLADLVRFLFASAWRKGEACSLVWSWVDDDAIRLPTSKNGQPRILALAGDIAEVIAVRRSRAVGEYVFHRHGKPLQDFRTAWKVACERAGLPGRLVHDLRRSAIKRLIEGGVDQRTAMSISGHRTVSTFQRYQIVDVRRQVEALEAVKRPQAREGR